VALSLSVPIGLRGQHGGISDQFFKPRVSRLYTSWETTLGWVRSQKPSWLLHSRGLVLTLAWCRDRNEGKIKPRRKLKRGTEGSWKDRGQDAHASPFLPSASHDSLAYIFTNLIPTNTSLFLAFRLSFLGRIIAARKRRDCSSSYVRILPFHPSLSLSLIFYTFVPSNLFHAYFPSMLIVHVCSIFIMPIVLAYTLLHIL